MVLLLLIALLGIGTVGQEKAPPFEPGQVWEYHNRADDAGSTLTILKVEDDPKLGRIVHVLVTGARVRKGAAQPTTIQHMPFAESAVRKSVTRLVQEIGPVPDFEEGYRVWRDAVDAGQGGIYTITVSEAIQAIADSLNQ